MKSSEQTLQQLERVIRKIEAKYPPSEEAVLMTDIHIRVTQETGELLVFNDDDNEITRCVVEQWIDNKDDDFYKVIASVLRMCLENQKESIESMSILKPFSFVLEDEEKESVEELYIVDDEIVMINPDLMEGLEDDLDNFLENLLKD